MMRSCVLFVLLIVLSPVSAQFDVNSVLTKNNTYCTNDYYYAWPKCVDNPSGYHCICGAGFYWNTKTCISDSVDSRLEFPAPRDIGTKKEFAYALLFNKNVPQLQKFTLSIYLKPENLSRRQCIFSYKYGRNGHSGIVAVFIGANIELEIAGQKRAIAANNIIKRNEWNHIVIAWFSPSGHFRIYANEQDTPLKQARNLAKGEVVESDGTLVLGQYSPDEDNNYNLSLAYEGSLAHVNLWSSDVMSNSKVKILRDDCTFTHCGDGVEWVDLRMGTRGLARLRWPSGLLNNEQCYTFEETITTCDQYCSHTLGIQCREEKRESIEWMRFKADGVLHVNCPGYDNSTEEIPQATRSCTSPKDIGKWGEPNVENCLTEFYKAFNIRVNSYIDGKQFDKSYVLLRLQSLKNHTQTHSHNNPVDISAAVDALRKLMIFQKETIERMLVQPVANGVQSVANRLTYQDTINISNLHASIINNLMDERNLAGWNMTIPSGQEADELLQVVNDLMYLLSQSLIYHVMNGEVVMNAAIVRINLEHIALKINVHKQNGFYGITFPDGNDLIAMEISERPGIIIWNKNDLNPKHEQDYLAVSICRLDSIYRLFYEPKQEDRINSAVFGVRLHRKSDQRQVENMTNVKMSFTYMNSHNVSNPKCIQIEHGLGQQQTFWKRNFSACSLVRNDSESADCVCSGSGFFSATTDMYNINWNIPEPPIDLMILPSYLGCSFAIFLAICTISMLVYVGTSSRTAVCHKHFTVAIILNTSTFMIGIELTSNEIVCKMMAILFHYFFLCMYSWLMNEAFNLYISITYTAHNQSAPENSGYWKLYLIGWAFPGVLVAALVGSNFKNYFATNMCLIVGDKVWLFVGPPLAMISVSLLVMTFAAKENHEVSYTKNESANKITEYHSNAVWTQIILVTCTWAFAFLSLNYQTTVFKWVFFIFNTAQGLFLFVFFFLLNEEVRSVFKTKEIKQSLGWDTSGPYSDNDSPEEELPLTSQMIESQEPLHQTNTHISDEHLDLEIKNLLSQRHIDFDALTETSV